MPFDTLENALAHELSDLLSAETQFAKALRQTAKAGGPVIKELAQAHLEETLQHAENLKKAFAALGKKPEKGVVCKGAAGIVEENSSMLEEEKPTGVLKDIALAGGSLRVEHYEIAGYTAAIALAKAQGQKEVVTILTGNLNQEKATAKKLEQASVALLKDAKAAPTAPAAATKAAPKAKATKAPKADGVSGG